MQTAFNDIVLFIFRFLVFSYRTGVLWGVLAWMVVFGAVGAYYERQQQPLQHWSASDMNDQDTKNQIMTCKTLAQIYSRWPGHECTQARINEIRQSRADNANYWAERNRSTKSGDKALIAANFAFLFAWIAAAIILSGKRRAKLAAAAPKQA